MYETVEGVPDAWRCTNCKALMHNVEWQQKKDNKTEWVQVPAPGGPRPNFVSLVHNTVCNLCFAMYSALSDNMYWKKIHAEHVIAEENKQKRIDRYRNEGT